MAAEKVGSIDDPIWQTRTSAEVSRRRLVPRARRRVWTLAVGIVIVAVAVITIWRLESPPGGDPNNAVYTELKDTLLTMPPGVANARLGAATPTGWVSGCPGSGVASSGWSKVYVSVTFTDSDSPMRVQNQINAALSRTGWVRSDERLGPDQGKIAHWFKKMREGQVANIFTYPIRRPGNWSMTASWQPPVRWDNRVRRQDPLGATPQDRRSVAGQGSNGSCFGATRGAVAFCSLWCPERDSNPHALSGRGF